MRRGQAKTLRALIRSIRKLLGGVWLVVKGSGAVDGERRSLRVEDRETVDFALFDGVIVAVMQGREGWYQRGVLQHLLHARGDEIRLRVRASSSRLRIRKHACSGRTCCCCCACLTTTAAVDGAVRKGFLAQQQLPGYNGSCGEESPSATLGDLDGHGSSVRRVVEIVCAPLARRFVHGFEIVLAVFPLAESLLRPRELLFGVRVIREVD